MSPLRPEIKVYCETVVQWLPSLYEKYKEVLGRVPKLDWKAMIAFETERR